MHFCPDSSQIFIPETDVKSLILPTLLVKNCGEKCCLGLFDLKTDKSIHGDVRRITNTDKRYFRQKGQKTLKINSNPMPFYPDSSQIFIPETDVKSLILPMLLVKNCGEKCCLGLFDPKTDKSIHGDIRWITNTDKRYFRQKGQMTLKINSNPMHFIRIVRRYSYLKPMSNR